jgi:bifunctional non-homologous end joining protein LigD
MKRTPDPHPDWLQTCSIRHASASVIAFPVIDDLAALLWVVNLGCIDLNQWYARCDDVNRPDYVHFDLDPVMDPEGKPASWKLVLETACAVRDSLDRLQLPSYPKTSGSRGIHVYVPIERGPLQKQVWTFAKQFAKDLEAKHPAFITAEYRIAKRPAGRVLVDYNQNAWGRTLASVYSVRPRPEAPVSTPVTWDEVAAGFHITDFVLQNVPDRVRERGDLFLPLLQPDGRASLERFLK